MERPLVLIVDDEPLIGSLLEDAFEDAGFDVSLVFGGAEAITDLGHPATPFAALVTDINLEGDVDGWSIAVEARRADPNIPVVYVTGDSAADWSALGVPNSTLVQKPFVIGQIVTAVLTMTNDRPPSATAPSRS